MDHRSKTTHVMIKVFENQEQKIFRNHLGRLVQLAKADGEFHRKEQYFIRKLARANGLEGEEIDQIMFHNKKNIVDKRIPVNLEDRFNQLVDFVTLMAEDGVILESELKLSKSLANQLGFNKTIAGLLINKIERGLSEGLSKKDIQEECQLFLSY